MIEWGWVWSILWWTFEFLIFVGAIFLVIMVLVDLFRDRTLAVGWKVLWIIFIIFVPVIGALVYLIARGPGMAERSAARRVGAAPEDDSYRPQASSSPADDIASAKAMLDSGVITQGEFNALKSKALGNEYYG